MKNYNVSDISISLKEISSDIKNGKIIIYPTDTVYGLGATIDDPKAIEKIYRVKSRNFKMPLIALVDGFDKIEKIAHVDGNNKKIVQALTDRFWPGGLTIILQKNDCVPDIMVSGGNTVGIRMPDHKLALEIIKGAGGILPTTSANISGERTPCSYDELSDEIKNRVDIVVDGGRSPISIASTIVDLSGEKVKILRHGAISDEKILEVINNL